MIAEPLAEEHAEIDRLLAAGDVGSVRRMLLRHIAMEEKVLLPAVRDARGGEPLPIAAQLRRDHAKIAALLASAPGAETIENLRALLARHNPLEEGADGLYQTCERVLGPERSAEVAERMRKMPQVRVRPDLDRGQ